MRITGVSVENFRCFEKFVLDLAGQSRLLVGENAIGKSALITAIARGLGKERTFHRNDFLDLTKTIEIRVTVTELDAAQLGMFHDAADFGATTTLTLGVVAAWDEDTEECAVTHGYPTKAWKPSKQPEREAIDIDWIPDNREAARLLQFGARRGLLANVMAGADLADPIAKAIEGIKKACDDFAAAKALETLMDEAGKELRKLVPAVAANPYGVESAASTELAVLRQLQLSLEHSGPSLPLANQSSGLAQLSLFAFSLLSIAQRPGSVLLIDEPELALHAHCQRALLSVLRALPNQFLISTHSASLLDRADPRQIVRLYRDGGSIKDARPSTLSDAEASALTRYMTSQNAEAFFARRAILVEGLSDKYAIEALAARKNRNFDAEGVSIVTMEGASGIATFLALLGPRGLRVSLAGMCDASDEANWATALSDLGFGAGLNRAAMAALGYFVCDEDLEDELANAFGDNETVALIESQGDKPAFEKFVAQPAHAAKPLHDQLCEFLHKRGRQIRYAPLLVDAIDTAKMPAPLEGVVNAV